MWTANNFEAPTLKRLAQDMAEYYWDCVSEPTINEVKHFSLNHDRERSLTMKGVKIFEDAVHSKISQNREQSRENQEWGKHCYGAGYARP